MTAVAPVDAAAAASTTAPRLGSRRLSLGAWLGLLPFLAYVTVFLVWPTLSVIARGADGRVVKLAVASETLESGVVKIRGSIAELGLEPGEWLLEFQLLRAGWPPRFEQKLAQHRIVIEPQ